jgi:hypothetical protein
LGASAADKLKEIEQVRASLASKLDEIEKRFPLAGMGKKVAAAVAGTSLATPALAFMFRRRGKKKDAEGKRRRGKGKAELQPQVIAPNVNINVLPKGAAYLAAAGLAGFAGLKIYEALQRKRNGGSSAGFKPQVVSTRPDAGRQTGN